MNQTNKYTFKVILNQNNLKSQILNKKEQKEEYPLYKKKKKNDFNLTNG